MLQDQQTIPMLSICISDEKGWEPPRSSKAVYVPKQILSCKLSNLLSWYGE